MSDIPLKRCSHCRRFKPATKDFFVASNTKDGFHNLCRECSNELANERVKHHQFPAPGTIKTCPQCHIDKPATTEYFGSHRRAKDHLYYICKECRNAAARKPPRYVVPEGYKRCPQCEENKPATLEYFYRHNDGLDGWCKLCHQRKSRSRKAEINPHITHKTCIQCGIEYPATPQHFYRSPQGVNRLTARCKVCLSTESASYRLRNRNAVLRRLHRWQQANREHSRSYSRMYYATHRQHYREYWQQYYPSHKEQINYTRRLHKEQGNARVRNRRARLKSIPGTHTAAQIQEQLKRQHYRCYYAACSFSKFPRVKDKDGAWKYLYEVDHTFPVSRIVGTDIPGNDMGYLVLACKSCNDRKNNRYPHEWPEGGRLL